MQRPELSRPEAAWKRRTAESALGGDVRGGPIACSWIVWGAGRGPQGSTSGESWPCGQLGEFVSGLAKCLGESGECSLGRSPAWGLRRSCCPCPRWDEPTADPGPCTLPSFWLSNPVCLSEQLLGSVPPPSLGKAEGGHYPPCLGE